MAKAKDKLVLKYYSDDGHGWVAVKIELLKSLGILSGVSAYSYYRGKTAYLEEDCDLSILVRALKDSGVNYEFIEKRTNGSSPIRSYDRIGSDMKAQYGVAA